MPCTPESIHLSDTLQGGRHKKFVVNPRLRYFKPHATRIERTFAEEISSSLGEMPRSIHPKFFYDRRGSELFEEICSVPEYYPTRSEISILEGMQGELGSLLDGDFRLVELGSGSSTKTRILLDYLTSVQSETEYFPIDISDILAESSEELLDRYANLLITGIIDTYEGGLEFLRTYDDRRNLVIFLGSSYGNFSPDDGRRFLENVSGTMKPGDMFLIGLDLVKDRAVLESAYDDPAGATARFNLNVLSRINDELDADFDLDNFEHHAFYNEQDRRIEMYIRSAAAQSVVVSKSGLELRLQRGELIHTEYSHKYSLPQIRDLLGGAGLEARRTWLDKKGYFSLTLASKG